MLVVSRAGAASGGELQRVTIPRAFVHKTISRPSRQPGLHLMLLFILGWHQRFAELRCLPL